MGVRMGGYWRFAIVVAVLGASACDSAEERAEQHFTRGVALVSEGRDSQASLEFRNALRLVGDHAASRRELGEIAERAGNLRAAMGHFRAAAESDAADVTSRTKLAAVLAAGGALDDAARYAEEALTLAPGDPDVLATIAAVRLRSDETEAALDAARQAIAVDPRNLTANTVLISERLTAGDFEGALALTEAELTHNPDDLSLNLVRLRVLGERGDDDEALGAQLERIVEISPREVSFRQALATLRAQRGDFAGAEAQLRTITEINPNQFDPIVDLVRFIARAHGIDAAEAELFAQIDVAGPRRRQRLRQVLADLYFQTDRRDDGRRVLVEVADGDGDEALAARVRLGRLAALEGNRAEAERIIAEVLAADAENAEALGLRARFALEDVRPVDAIADLRRAQESDPDSAEYLVLEAQAHELAGDRALAGERLASAVRVSNYDPTVALVYARFLRNRNEASAAESLLSETARRHPDSRDILSALASVRVSEGDLTGAGDAAEALRRLDGGEIVAGQVMAAILSAQGRATESIDVLESLATIQQPDAAMSALVAAYVRDGASDRAVSYLDGVIQRNPTEMRARILRAELYALTGDLAAAERALRDAALAAPESPLGHAALATLLGRLGRADEALVTIEDGLATVGAPLQLLALKGQFLELRGDFDGAIDAYAAAYEIQPDALLVVNNLASLLAEYRADEPESMALAERVSLRLRGYELPHFQDTYGWVRFLVGDVEEAAVVLSKAAEQLPDLPLVRYHAGRATAAVGETERARGHLEAALAIDPDFPKAASAREALAALPIGQ